MKTGWIIFIMIALVVFIIGACDAEQDDPWTNYDGSRIVCQRTGCGRTPLCIQIGTDNTAPHISKKTITAVIPVA